jgi:hypothetical protein
MNKQELYLRYTKTDDACTKLRVVIRQLVEAGTPKAADAVRRALKSVEGARRNAARFADIHQFSRDELQESRAEAKRILGGKP